ncbi:hypothetical protein KIPB_005748 [Kipferlia bialata]|uniref:Protein kinase domain-containing protein n=1 Tax=Kipferlia bialata TaxID=797122 RepID=A0A9K3CWH6_9EUKA|nr:hypothetical protein KIPB_005748 [Kipferlia bialata]|eukprot:g5748.t1
MESRRSPSSAVEPSSHVALTSTAAASVSDCQGAVGVTLPDDQTTRDTGASGDNSGALFVLDQTVADLVSTTLESGQEADDHAVGTASESRDSHSSGQTDVLGQTYDEVCSDTVGSVTALPVPSLSLVDVPAPPLGLLEGLQVAPLSYTHIQPKLSDSGSMSGVAPSTPLAVSGSTTSSSLTRKESLGVMPTLGPNLLHSADTILPNTSLNHPDEDLSQSEDSPVVHTGAYNEQATLSESGVSSDAHIPPPSLALSAHVTVDPVLEVDGEMAAEPVDWVEEMAASRHHSARSLDEPTMFQSPTSTYRSGRKLGAGAFADVVEVHDCGTGVRYAAKILKALPENRFNWLHKDPLILDSPYVVKIKERFTDPNRDCRVIIMELLEGCTLTDYMSSFPERSASNPMPGMLQIMEQILRGVAALKEAGVVHRDLKPDNIMVNASPTIEVKIVDLDMFGIATEDWRPDTSVLFAGDIWATGLIFAQKDPMMRPGIEKLIADMDGIIEESGDRNISHSVVSLGAVPHKPFVPPAAEPVPGQGLYHSNPIPALTGESKSLQTFGLFSSCPAEEPYPPVHSLYNSDAGEEQPGHSLLSSFPREV